MKVKQHNTKDEHELSKYNAIMKKKREASLSARDILKFTIVI